MIYMGQELGEAAKEAEGYSGYDGRTTIYDYWSLETLRRWLNSGAPSEANLTERQQWLRSKYAAILGICNREQAIANGRFFDLMYVNYENPTLNPHRQYVFMRSQEGVTLLIAVNFSSDSCDLAVNIPRHALEMLNIPEGQVMSRELLTGETDLKTLSSTEPFTTMIPPYDAVVWKIKHRDVREK